MKFLMLLVVALIAQATHAQHTDEVLIRKLENQEREAILKGDTAQLYRLMSKDIIVQNPENKIVGFRTIMDRVQTGKINYSSFERVIQQIAFVKGMAVVMGQETLTPQGDTTNPGKK